MRQTTYMPARPLLVLIAGLFLSGAALADKPDWAGGGNDKGRGKGERQERHDDGGERRGARDGYDAERRGGDRHEGRSRDTRHRDGATIQLNAYFGDQERRVMHDYYGEQFRRGHCPPGLAKKGNGCQPPGQAKKWRVGHTLPRDVVYYDLAPAVVVRIGLPPAGHRYVRVASDILLIAIGTGMVIDAIEDLGRM